MRIEDRPVNGAYCTMKYLLLIDNEPVIFANTDYTAKLMEDYIKGSDKENRLLNDRIISILKPYREMYLKENLA